MTIEQAFIGLIFGMTSVLIGAFVMFLINRKTKPKTIGTIHIYENMDEEKDRYLFEFTEDPEEIPKNMAVTFKVVIETKS